MNRLFSMLLSVTGLSATVAFADDYAQGWGPEVGSQLPVLDAPDQAGRTQTLETLRGERGLLLFFNRSADW